MNFATRWARFVALPLLDIANDSPPFLERRAFYALKRRLLERYAMPDGVDVQVIEDVCWNCDGKGCARCGDGVYRLRFNELRRWRWGAHSFHTWERQLSSPLILPTINGRVTHAKRRPGHLPAEAWYWLALLYDRPAFWRSFGHVGHRGRRFTPLVVLGTLLFEWRWRRETRELPF